MPARKRFTLHFFLTRLKTACIKLEAASAIKIGSNTVFDRSFHPLFVKLHDLEVIKRLFHFVVRQLFLVL